MYYSLFASKELVIKEESIDNYIGCCELGGSGDIQVSNNTSSPWHYIILCNRGELQIRTREMATTIRRGVLNVFDPSDLLEVQYRKNFHGYLVAIDKALLFDIIRNRSPFPRPNQGVLGVRIHHGDIDLQTMRTLANDCKNMIRALGNKEHSLLEELSYAHLYIFLTDIADIVWRHIRMPHARQKDNGALSRPKDITMKFMELASKHVDKEPFLDFYAEKLFISKQYLSEIILGEIGITAGKALAKIRYEHCLRCINDRSFTLKQIADRHSFTDQSAFGKFFKQHSGKSPAQFRKEMKISLLSNMDNKSM